MIENHKVLPKAEWIEARKKLLAREKEFTRLRDQLSEERRNLPWERVEKNYVFDGPDGKESLSDLFDGRQQLIVHHFMFDPSWEAGCKSCSETVGFSVFHKDPDGVLYHTYSCYSRGGEMVNGAYHFLDLLPKGRGESRTGNPQTWVRYHDSYGR
jgi:predicted dithiol-disulfide oxidoreductase (DUF899 family)